MPPHGKWNRLTGSDGGYGVSAYPQRFPSYYGIKRVGDALTCMLKNKHSRILSLYVLLCLLALKGIATAADTEATASKPLQAGDFIPLVTLQDSEGEPVALHERVHEQPTVLIFYRGSWCPYCTEHLSELAEVEAQLVELGYRIIAVSPDRPAKLRELQEEFPDANYTYLSDNEARAAEAFGLAFTVDAETREKYRDYGIDLEKASGHDHYKLPIPAAYLIGTDGRILYAHANEDYKVRVDAQSLLKEATSAAGE